MLLVATFSGTLLAGLPGVFDAISARFMGGGFLGSSSFTEMVSRAARAWALVMSK